MSTRRGLPRWDYRLADGSPAVGWAVAGRGRRVAAWLLDLALFGLTIGVGWLAWAWWTWPAGRTPGQGLLGLTVFGTDTRRPAGRPRMALRALVYQPLGISLGVATLGLSWLYCVGAALGTGRRTIHDEWTQTVLLSRAAAGPTASRRR